MSQKIIEKGRNWTAPETGAFCEILVDQVFNFAETLETKALKKSANKEVFEAIQSEFKDFFARRRFHRRKQGKLSR